MPNGTTSTRQESVSITNADQSYFSWQSYPNRPVRITGLAENASQGNLSGPRSYLKDEYYRVSTIYRFLAPSAALKLMQRRLTALDLSLDEGLRRYYVLARQAFLAIGDEFAFARMGQPLDYRPFDPRADTLQRTSPAIFGCHSESSKKRSRVC
jgi:hypothetical protein